MAYRNKANLFIVGAAKCGTTSLYHYLRKHPSVFMSPHKEPNFLGLEHDSEIFYGPGDDESFNRVTIRNIDDYNKLFSDVNGQSIVGECSTFYLQSKVAANNIYNYNNESKIIIILRNPIDRAFSSYQHMVRENRETKTFIDALNDEEIRIKNRWEHLWHYLDGGLYHDKINRYINIFPRNQIYIGKYDDFINNPKLFLENLYNFLNIEWYDVDFNIKYNISGSPRIRIVHDFINKANFIKEICRPFLPKKIRRNFSSTVNRMNIKKSEKKIPSEIYNKLLKYYSKDISAVESLSGLDLSGWSKKYE